MVNEIFVMCKRGSDGLNITLDEYTGDVLFSVWYYSKPELTVMNKLRWIWHIVKGKPYPDEVVVTRGWLPLIIDKLKSMNIDAYRITEGVE